MLDLNIVPCLEDLRGIFTPRDCDSEADSNEPAVMPPAVTPPGS
jgi:hypothetical protein